MNINLTPVIGEKKARSVKKALFYFTLALGSLAASAVSFFIYTIYRVLKEDDYGWLSAHPLVVALFAVFGPIIFFSIGRIWYKYNAMKEDLAYQMELNEELYELIQGGRGELLRQILNVEDKIVRTSNPNVPGEEKYERKAKFGQTPTQEQIDREKAIVEITNADKQLKRIMSKGRSRRERKHKA